VECEQDAKPFARQKAERSRRSTERATAFSSCLAQAETISMQQGLVAVGGRADGDKATWANAGDPWVYSEAACRTIATAVQGQKTRQTRA
jgi:hypothetical protein